MVEPIKKLRFTPLSGSFAPEPRMADFLLLFSFLEKLVPS